EAASATDSDAARARRTGRMPRKAARRSSDGGSPASPSGTPRPGGRLEPRALARAAAPENPLPEVARGMERHRRSVVVALTAGAEKPPRDRASRLERRGDAAVRVPHPRRAAPEVD